MNRIEKNDESRNSGYIQEVNKTWSYNVAIISFWLKWRNVSVKGRVTKIKKLKKKCCFL